MINGIPTTINESVTTTYQVSYPVASPLSISSTVTLPNGETYDGTKDELVVSRNGVKWNEGVHYQYQNSTTATYITLLVAVPSGGDIEFQKVT